MIFGRVQEPSGWPERKTPPKYDGVRIFSSELPPWLAGLDSVLILPGDFRAK